MTGKDINYRDAMNILSQIIGGDINSRMFNILREQHGFAYTVDFDYNLLNNLGYYNLFTIVDKEKENIATDLIFKIFNDIKKNGVTKEEIIRAKKYLLGQSRMDEESVLSQATIISVLLTLGYDYDFYLNREKRIEMVEQENILEIVNEYMNVEDMYMLIMN